MTREQHLAETLEWIEGNLSFLVRNPTAIPTDLRTEILSSLAACCQGAITRSNYDEVTT